MTRRQCADDDICPPDRRDEDASNALAKFDLDDVGNRDKVQRKAKPSLGWTDNEYDFNTLNEYTRVENETAGTRFQDRNGNLTKDDTHSHYYHYDWANRLVKITDQVCPPT